MDLLLRCVVALVTAGCGIVGAISLASMPPGAGTRPFRRWFAAAFLLLLAGAALELSHPSGRLGLLCALLASSCALSGWGRSRRARAPAGAARLAPVGVATVACAALNGELPALASGRILTELQVPVVVVLTAGGGIELCQN